MVFVPRAKECYDHIEMRKHFSFEPEDATLDPDDWDCDPIDEMNFDNFIFSKFPQNLILRIFDSLPIIFRKSFIASFGSDYSNATEIMLKRYRETIQRHH